MPVFQGSISMLDIENKFCEAYKMQNAGFILFCIVIKLSTVNENSSFRNKQVGNDLGEYCAIKYSNIK